MFYIYLYSNLISVLYFTLIQEYKLSLGGETFCQTIQRKGHDDAHFCTAFFTAPCQWDVQTSIDVSLPIYERGKKEKSM